MTRTNRTEQTNKLSRTEANFLRILSEFGDGIAVSDRQGEVIEWDQGIQDITGIPAGQALQKSIWELLSPPGRSPDGFNARREKIQEQVLESIRSGKSIHSSDPLVFDMHSHGHQQRHVEAVFLPLEAGRGARVVCLLRDLTEGKEAARKLSLQNDILEAAANGIAITTRQGEIVWVNPAFTRLTGYTPDEVLGKTFQLMKSGKQSPGQYQNLWETVLAGQIWQGELVNRRKDGSLYTEEQTITPVRDERGDITHFIAIMQDVTQRKQAEEALHVSERRHREILDNIKLVAIMLDTAGKLIYCNKFFLELTGWKRDEVIGKDWFKKFLPIDVRAEVSRLFFSQEIPPHYENEILTRSGEKRLITWNNAFQKNAQGSLFSVTSIGEDITERKRAEMEAARLAAVVEQVAEGVVITDLNKQILYANPFIETLTGFNRSELLGENYQALQEGESNPKFLEEIWASLENGKTWQGTLVSTRKDGHLFHEETTLFPIKDASGQVINYASIGRDITDRVIAEEQIQLQLRRLAALRTIDLAISSSLDLRVVLNVLLDQIVTQLDADAAALLLLNPHTQTLEFGGGRGFRRSAIQQSYLQLGQGLAGQVASERRVISVPNFHQIQDIYTRAPLITGEDFQAYHAVPLVAKGQVKGVLEIYNRLPFAPEQEWLDYLDTLAGQAAIAIDNATLLADLQRSNEELVQAYVTTLEGWVKTLGLRDDETEDHTQRVTTMTLRLASALGVNDLELIHIRRGALLHDIGKMAVPDHILLKDGPLDENEWEIMKKHPVDAFELLAPITYLRPALDIPYCHHEKWDGSGYPRGLKGEDIPLAARLFAVADVWDALRSDRPYRKAWSKDKAVAYLRQHAGSHFDPRVLKVFFDSGINHSNGDQEKSPPG
jgi:PAS domain S-box-containing protein/putative nucleotidyltransferase with HDIG domain